MEFLLQIKLHEHKVAVSLTFSGHNDGYKQIDVMSTNSFRCRYTAEVAYDMLSED